MNKANAYRNTLLSILCIISWAVILGRISKASPNDKSTMQIAGGLILTALVAIIVGFVLLFYGMLIKRSLRHTFVYNLVGSLNLATSILGIILLRAGRPTPSLAAASLTIGVAMYVSIFKVKKGFLGNRESA